jgi:F-type H+-transporting ATPase subunit b
MDATLHALGGILLRAIPTFLLVIFLHIYLKMVFFKPLEKVLKQRYEATEGARKLAEQSLDRASAKTAEYEAAIRAARAEAYQAQERLYKELHEREAAELATARQQAEAAIREAKESLAKDVASAQASLAQESDALAVQIADSLLRGSAA